jgi:glutaredoxin
LNKKDWIIQYKAAIITYSYRLLTCAIYINSLYILTSLIKSLTLNRMLTKFHFLQTATAIGMAIGTLTTSLVKVQANPSISTPSQVTTPSAQLVAETNTKPRRYSRSIALGAKVETVSGASEVALAEYLATKDVKFYGAYWCSHCQRQKSLFGAVAAAKIPYVECAADGDNSQRELCKTKKIRMFPTWIINGKAYQGTKNLKEIADLVGYSGPANFQYQK